MPKANNEVVDYCKCHGCGAKVELRLSGASGNLYYTCDGKAEPSKYCNSMMKFGRAPSAKIKEMIDYGRRTLQPNAAAPRAGAPSTGADPQPEPRELGAGA